MPDEELKLYEVLFETILPNLSRIQASQSEQRMQADRLSQDLQAFRAEMKARFDTLHAELAAARHQMDVTLASLRESEARVAALVGMDRNQIIH